MNQKTKEFRQNIADAFVQALTEKNLDWKKEWKTQTPINAITGKCYKGINRFALSFTTMLQCAKTGEEADCRWATFKQINDKGWKVKKGAKGQKVEYWQPYDFDKKMPITWENLKARQGGDENVGVIAKYYVVFNGRDIEGIPKLQPHQKGHVLSDEIINKIAAGMNIEIRHDGVDRAFYLPSDDSIHLPKPENFYSSYAYNATALHELSHATGAAHRLNRNIKNHFGTESYAYEELVAEISSCFMGEHLEIIQTEDHIQNHKAYVTSWIQSIKERPEALIAAIRDAGEAANYLEYQAGILSKEEYQKSLQESMEIPQEKVQENTTKELFAESVKEDLINEVKANLKAFINSDLQMYGKVTSDTQKAISMQGYIYKNGELEKKESVVQRTREADLKANGYKPTATLMKHMDKLDKLTGKKNDVKDIHRAFKNHDYQDNPDLEKAIKSIGKILQNQELDKVSVPLQ